MSLFKKSRNKKLARTTLMISIIMSSMLAFSSDIVMALDNQSSKINIERISGKDRYETSFEISKKIKSDTIFIVGGEAIADSLSIASVSSIKKMPILLSKKDEDINSKIEKLKAKNVVVIGGENSVTKFTYERLKQKFNVRRISGKNRYETSLKVVEYLGAKNVGVSDGNVYADGLSAATFLASKNLPLLLIDGKNTSSLPNGLKGIYTFGGKDSVSHTFGTRIHGADRYHTSLNILKASNKKEKIALVSGDKYSDALTVSPYLFINDYGILLTEKEDMEKDSYNYLSNANKILIIGGESSISSDLERQLYGKKYDEDQQNASIASSLISAYSRNSSSGSRISNSISISPVINKNTITNADSSTTSTEKASNTIPSSNKDQLANGNTGSSENDTATNKANSEERLVENVDVFFERTDEELISMNGNNLKNMLDELDDEESSKFINDNVWVLDEEPSDLSDSDEDYKRGAREFINRFKESYFKQFGNRRYIVNRDNFSKIKFLMEDYENIDEDYMQLYFKLADINN